VPICHSTTTSLWTLLDMVRVLEEWEAGRAGLTAANGTAA
jgi:hypothetical protein